MTDDLIARLREAARYADEYEGERDLWTEAAARIAELEKMLAIHRLAVDVDALKARIAELEAALKLMIDTQDEWEKGVSKVIGKQPSVFNRAIDTARAVLEKNNGIFQNEKTAKLEAEIEKLKAALKPFASLLNEEGDYIVASPSLSDLRAARAAYIGEKHDNE
jgi:hypothetical protein